jgi:hydrophobic/amphiphilic exporter-1 (mainly G- bacteria), HAE1 family
LPIAFGRGSGSGSRASMAVTIIGGQAICLLLTLLVTPVIYSLFDDAKLFFRRLRSKSHEEKAAIETPAPEEAEETIS